MHYFDTTLKPETYREITVGEGEDETRLGHVQRVPTSFGMTWEALVQTGPHQHLFLGFFDTEEEAAEQVLEWDV